MSPDDTLNMLDDLLRHIDVQIRRARKNGNPQAAYIFEALSIAIGATAAETKRKTLGD